MVSAIGRLEHSPAFSYDNLQIRGDTVATATKTGVCVAKITPDNSFHAVAFKVLVSETSDQHVYGAYVLGDEIYPHIAVCMAGSMEIYTHDLSSRVFSLVIDAEKERSYMPKYRQLYATTILENSGLVFVGLSSGSVHVVETSPAFVPAASFSPDITGLSGSVAGFVATPNGVIAVSSAGQSAIVSATTATPGPDLGLAPLCLAPALANGKLVLGCQDGTVCLVSPDGTGSVSIPSHTSPVLAVATVGTLFASAGGDGVVRVTDPTGPSSVLVERVYDGMLCGVQFMPERQVAVAVCDSILVPIYMY
ncbi:WD domain, G-beta repeat [Carpediemonas membranifera]|uniref:WD domain, G-beta repeat n=1 Tax=Carpediemonas membranifera TaxID=201153 RepID=A0A8J6AW60_9EUKA|nr:WD domain, G-beta repeat [Carpediemonas membranifera]|eukprot:KAG9396316.1 WD domain, G-beta repeat [Carpediemonas membranifera]